MFKFFSKVARPRSSCKVLVIKVYLVGRTVLAIVHLPILWQVGRMGRINRIDELRGKHTVWEPG